MPSRQTLTSRKLVQVMLSPVFAALLAGSFLAQAQPTAPMVQPNATNPASAGKPSAPIPATKGGPPVAAAVVETKPLWKELTPGQQTALKPLAANWSIIDEPQKRKWLAISNNYPALPPAEQQKMHSRMAEWTSLSKQQRDQARLNFAESNKLAPKEKAAKTASKAADWEAYQALSPEEKQKLAAKATPKPAGAAVAVKSLLPEKLATVPSTRLSPKPNEIGAPPSGVNSTANALQPKAAGAPDAPGAPGSAIQKN